MNKAAFTEDELRQAALQVHEAMMAVLTPVTEHNFSFEFRRKMSNLLLKMKLHHGIKAAARSVAAVFLALLIGGSALLTFNTDVRAAFFSWVREIYENSVFYQFVGEKEPDVLPYIRPMWLPEGYVEVDVVGNEYQQTVVYQNVEDTSKAFTFTYSRNAESKELWLYSEGFAHEEVTVNNFAADLYTPYDTSETNELLWVDENSGIIYKVSAYETANIMLHIAESIYLIE